MPSSPISRRGFLLSASVLTATNTVRFAAATQKSSTGDVRLGVASYSLRKLTRTQAIAAIKAIKTPYVNVKEFHLPYKSTAEELESGRTEFVEAGLQIVGGGTITLQEDTDEGIRKYFEYAKRCGMPLMVIAPTSQTLPRIESFVKQYDIKVAIHNHGPEDKHFPTPQSALKLIKHMDHRIGLCIDVGHTARTGVDVVKSLAEAGPRLLDMHMKDLRSFSEKDAQCRVGEGIMPIPEIFKQLKKMNYAGTVNLEYEIDAENPLPGMLQSFAYMRGVLAGLRG